QPSEYFFVAPTRIIVTDLNPSEFTRRESSRAARPTPQPCCRASPLYRGKRAIGSRATGIARTTIEMLWPAHKYRGSLNAPRRGVSITLHEQASLLHSLLQRQPPGARVAGHARRLGRRDFGQRLGRAAWLGAGSPGQHSRAR